MKTMNEERQTANSRKAYEAPKCETVELQSEGVLCFSGGASATHESFSEVDCSNIWDN